jgi:hypothetical protein
MNMRAETKKIVTAFLTHKPATGAPTRTDGHALYLHNNRIAWHDSNGVSMTMCGWGSVTTRERLNGLCELLIGRRPYHQHKHEQFYDEQPIDTRAVIHIRQINLLNDCEISHLLAV